MCGATLSELALERTLAQPNIWRSPFSIPHQEPLVDIDGVVKAASHVRCPIVGTSIRTDSGKTKYLAQPIFDSSSGTSRRCQQSSEGSFVHAKPQHSRHQRFRHIFPRNKAFTERPPCSGGIGTETSRENVIEENRMRRKIYIIFRQEAHHNTAESKEGRASRPLQPK